MGRKTLLGIIFSSEILLGSWGNAQAIVVSVIVLGSLNNRRFLRDTVDYVGRDASFFEVDRILFDDLMDDWPLFDDLVNNWSFLDHPMVDRSFFDYFMIDRPFLDDNSCVGWLLLEVEVVSLLLRDDSFKFFDSDLLGSDLEVLVLEFLLTFSEGLRELEFQLVFFLPDLLF